ncbi:MAG: winged helix-turn-helix transcriptional regulator [Spirochaetes bacterium]|nr:winged helix-turn-helix transcriptional regulator [Spirochaetota bacterium]
MVDFNETGAILKALGHPHRLEIVHNLMTNECNVNDMVRRLGIPQSTVSQHLRILMDRGIISPRKEGVVTCYRIVDERVKRLIEMLKG